MLKNQLYSIEQIEYQSSMLKADIKINETHPIFKGHFPDIPVLPGVTMMQIAKELIETVENKTFIIESASQLKFLQMLNPKSVNKVTWEISIGEASDNIYKIKAIMFKEETVFFKMTAKLLWEK